jgi:hypothetical protein
MLKKQRGLTMISWVFILGLIGIQAILAMRIVPVYIGFNTVKHIMNSLPDDPAVRSMSAKQLKRYISKRLKVDNMYELSRNRDAFKFVKKKTGLTLVLHYEERGAILGNLEFVASFDHQVTLPKKR